MTNHLMKTMLFCKEMITLKLVEFQVENYDSDDDKPELQSDNESEDKDDNDPGAGNVKFILDDW